MFRRILVPLDGSKRAEQAIPVAARIARAAGGSVILLQVGVQFNDYAWSSMGVAIMPETFEEEEASIKVYLTGVAAREVLEGVGTTTRVVYGSPAETILAEASQEQADLIVLCSHGYTGVKRWMLGSVAQKVARHSPVPVLILREDRGVPSLQVAKGARSTRVMVALDGSPLAESALGPATDLSIALSAPQPGVLDLVRVVPLSHNTGGGWEDEAIAARKIQAFSEAKTYLKMVEQQISTAEMTPQRLQTRTSVVLSPDVASALVTVAESGEVAGMGQIDEITACDVIVMATHGRGGIERWMMGSVTERVLETTKLPLLIIRPQSLEPGSRMPSSERAREEHSTAARS
jgi:nucleotide-binding universal stress UspA family protein